MMKKNKWQNTYSGGDVDDEKKKRENDVINC